MSLSEFVSRRVIVGVVGAATLLTGAAAPAWADPAPRPPNCSAANVAGASWLAVGAVLTAITSGCLMLPAGTADADVCASVGRRISASGCTNVADTVNGYVPPPGDYAPLPGDFPPPPPPPPPVSVCVGVGRRIHVSGCN